MVVEPPSNFRRTGIIEVDNRVFIAIELTLIKQRPGAMYQAGKLEVHIITNAFAIEARKQRRRRCPVETFVVIENSNPQAMSPVPAEFASAQPSPSDAPNLRSKS
jgi:hypothetical protein